MANNDGRSHENETFARYPVEDVSPAELGTMSSPLEGRNHADQNTGDTKDTSSYTNEMERRAGAFQQGDKTQEATQPRGETAQGRPADGLQQSHQQSEQASNTRAYAAEKGQEKGEAASLVALQQDATHVGQEREEGQSLDALHQDAQTVASRDQAQDRAPQTQDQAQLRDEQRLAQGRTQQQDQEKMQQQGKEKSNEQDKTPGR